MSEYEVVIGLEVHSELNTKTKCFCSCKNEFGAEPNTHCCPVCIGLPGSLPVVNKDALKKAVMMGLAVGCKINNYTVFERKNYYYPDLAKAYQISQMVDPICLGGHVDIEVDGKVKPIRFNHIHVEEDAAKLIHDASGTLVDYNRAGVPLIEMVTEPDMNSAKEAVLFLEKLRQILLYTGVSNAKMQEGNIKCDVNVSIHKPGTPLGTRAELKNLNSFKAIERAINYEIDRQTDILESGGKVVQETRRWDDEKGQTFAMRSKEDSQDYRYFPDPDILPIEVDNDFVDEIKDALPKLAEQRKQDYILMGLSEQDAGLLVSQKVYSDFFDDVCAIFNEPKFVCNWITSEVFKRLNTSETDDIVIPVCAKNMASLLKMYKDGTINQAGARQVFDIIWQNDQDPVKVVEEQGLKQVSDVSMLEEILKQIIKDNPNAVAELKGGNTKIVSFFVGQAMKASHGKANPKIINELLSKLI